MRDDLILIGSEPVRHEAPGASSWLRFLRARLTASIAPLRLQGNTLAGRLIVGALGRRGDDRALVRRASDGLAEPAALRGSGQRRTFTSGPEPAGPPDRHFADGAEAHPGNVACVAVRDGCRFDDPFVGSFSSPTGDPVRGSIGSPGTLPRSTAAGERSADPELIRAYAELTGRFPDESFSLSMIFSNRRTRKLQVGVLAAIVTITRASIALESFRTEARRGFAAPVGSVEGAPR